MPASASRISFLYIGRPSVGGFFHLHQPEVCQNWTMAQWDRFCKDCVQVQDATYHADLIDQPLLDRIVRQHGTHIIDHAERIGLGSRSYTLIDLADLTGIQLIFSQAMPQSYNIFRIDGTPVGTNMKSLDALSEGLYIINGKKVAIK